MAKIHFVVLVANCYIKVHPSSFGIAQTSQGNDLEETASTSYPSALKHSYAEKDDFPAYLVRILLKTRCQSLPLRANLILPGRAIQLEYLLGVC